MSARNCLWLETNLLKNSSSNHFWNSVNSQFLKRSYTVTMLINYNANLMLLKLQNADSSYLQVFN